MKKTLAVLMAALLAVACFAMVGSAAHHDYANNEDLPWRFDFLAVKILPFS